MKPYISVVVPAFNEEKYLGASLTALKNQDYPSEKFEIIVIDNGSNDKTTEVARSFDVKVISYSQEKSAAAARQKGIIEAFGEIIAFTDADTEVNPDWLKTIEKVFESREVVAVGGRVFPDKSNFLISIMFHFYDFFLRFNQLLGISLPWGNNFAARKSILEKVGGFNKALKTSEDWDLALRISKENEGKVIYNTKLIAYTSTRKHKNWRVFGRYYIEGLFNYFNIVVLRRSKSSEMRNVR